MHLGGKEIAREWRNISLLKILTSC